MEYGKDVIHFRVICGGDEFLIKEVIEGYNKTYKTDFEIVSFEELAGVLFADIKASDIKVHHIFDLGSSFGAGLQRLRDKREIDW